MNKIRCRHLLPVIAGAATALGGVAQAETYIVRSADSSLSDIRHFGGALIPEINDYAPHAVDGLDPTVVGNWPLMHWTQGTWDPADPTTPPVRGGHDIAIGGSVTIEDGDVTAAVLEQLEELRYGTFQSYNFVDDYGTVTDLVVNGLVWTWDPDAGTLLHQTAAEAGQDLAVCVPAAGGNFGGSTGTALSGQCNSLLRGAVNNATGTSVWGWDGVAGPTYIIKDIQNAPYHSGTSLTLDIGGHAAVTWDLSGFTAGIGGTVIAHVTNALFASDTNNATGIAATFTLEVALVEGVDDTFQVRENSTANPLDVLENDLGLTAPVTITVTAGPDAGGTVDFDDVDEQLVYTPALNYAGEESFTYEATGSGAGEVVSADVTVTVMPNDVPAIGDGNLEATAGHASAPLALALTLGDGERGEHSLTVTTQAAQGLCAISGDSVVYTPNADASGADSCVLTFADVDGDTATGTISITVAAAPADDDDDDESGQVLGGGKGGMSPVALGLLGLMALLGRRRRT